MDNENKVVEGVVKEKKMTPTEQNTKDIAELNTKFSALDGKLDQLLALFAAGNMSMHKEESEVKAEEKKEVVEDKNSQADIMDNPNKYSVSSTDEITFVHMVQRADGLYTYIKLSNLELNLSMIGELFRLPRLQADEFVGKYRNWFDQGIFAVYNDDISVRYGKTKKIKPASLFEYSKHNFQSIGELGYNELEDFVNLLAPAHKENVIEYFKQKVYEAMADPKNKDIHFCDLRKLEILNRLSGCDSLKYEIEDLKKIR